MFEYNYMLGDCESDNDDIVDDNGQSDSDEWFYEQSLPKNQFISGIDSPKYGFANQTQGVFRQVKVSGNSVINIIRKLR